MSTLAQRKLILIASACGFLGTLGWGFYVLVFVHEPAQDWMVFYSAARAYWDGNLPLIFDGERFTQALNTRFSDWLSVPLSLHPWINPPNFLLLILPFGLLPFGVSYVLFQAVGFLMLIGALRLYAKDRQRWHLFAAAIALCPAAALTIGVGQSSFLTGALFLGGFGILDRRPLLAGILLGLLAYKPQFGLMIPIALVAARQWRALAGGAISVSGVALLTVALFGIEPWRFWIEFATGASELYQNWASTTRLVGQSVYACIAMLGAPTRLADAAQVAAAIFAGGSVYWCFRREPRVELRLAVLLVGTLLAAPHVSWSDELLATLATLLMLGVALDEGFRPGDALVIVLVWLSPLVSPHVIFPFGRLIPLLLCVFVVWAMTRARPLASKERSSALQPAPP